MNNQTTDIIAAAEQGYQDAKIAFDTDMPASPEDNVTLSNIVIGYDDTTPFFRAYNKAYQTQLNLMYKEYTANIANGIDYT